MYTSYNHHVSQHKLRLSIVVNTAVAIARLLQPRRVQMGNIECSGSINTILVAYEIGCLPQYKHEKLLNVQSLSVDRRLSYYR
jgi:hypothetical protein